MFKRLFGCVREYKGITVLTMILMVLESAIETFIPFITAHLIGQFTPDAVTGEIAELSEVLKTGVLLIIMATCSLICGGLAGLTSAKAASGFAKNLRNDIFGKIQDYSFENIDKFSSTSLVTRLTTDVGHAQMSFMMIIRTAIRSPLLLIFSVIMAAIMGGVMAMTFVVVIPVLAVGLYLVARKAMPTFRRIFKKYDKLNESVEENVRGARFV